MTPSFAPRLVLVLALTTAIGSAQEGAAPPAVPKIAKKPPPPPEALAWKDEITRLPPGLHRDLAPVKVSYGLSWNNVLNAGEFEVTLKHSQDDPKATLVGIAEGRSNGLARALWPYDVEAEALVDRKTLRPKRFEISETERGMAHHYILDFAPNRVITHTTSRETKPKKGEGEPIISEKTYRYDFLQDVLSSVLYIRSHDLAEGDAIKVLVSPFNKPYHTEFEVLGRENRKIKGRKYESIKLAIEIRKINHDQTLQAYEKMKKATIWLSDDEFRLPLEVQADIFVGYISARLTGREWLTDASPASGEEGRAGILGLTGGREKPSVP